MTTSTPRARRSRRSASADSRSGHIELSGGLPAVLLRAVPAATRLVSEWPRGQRVAEADRLADVIATAAPAIVPASATGPARYAIAAEVSEALVFGLAVLAHRAGGVTFGGITWTETQPPLGHWSVPVLCHARRSVRLATTPAQARTRVTDTLGPLIVDNRPHLITGTSVMDASCGSGAFLVAATRFLSDKLTASWDARLRAKAMTVYATTDQVAAARAVVLDACIAGVDTDPLAVELARVVMQLLTPEHAPLSVVQRIRLDIPAAQPARASVQPTAWTRPQRDPRHSTEDHGWNAAHRHQPTVSTIASTRKGA